MYSIKNGLVYTAVDPEPFLADILIEDGKIKAIGQGIAGDCPGFDASGLRVYPGFVDAHSHIGLYAYGQTGEFTDYNERGDILSPQLRSIDAINPMDPSFRQAAEGGVTCVCTGPGSANVLGGTFCAMKTVGRRIDDMVVKAEVAMKCAFGENPKRVYRDKGNSSRMSTAAKLREALFKAREYKAKIDAAQGDLSKMPPFDMKLQSLIPVLNKEIPLKAHAHQANDIFTALRIAKEFDVDITLEHVTEGHLIADLLAKEGKPCAVGPTMSFASKPELREKSWITPAALVDAGLSVSIITDSDVTEEHYLTICAALAIKSGLSEEDALKAITINPARHIGVADRVGSLEEGKDADIVVTDGSPFEISTQIKGVWINGEQI
jgi:imidazolonepropionase-like amidohydrolase